MTSKAQGRIRATTMEMLSSIFTDIRRENDTWRDPIARCFEEVAIALELGVEPRDVALVCRAAATAIRDPKQAPRARRDCAAILGDRD